MDLVANEKFRPLDNREFSVLESVCEDGLTNTLEIRCIPDRGEEIFEGHSNVFFSPLN